MANARIRPFSLYFNGAKLGQMHQAKLTLQSGDEPQFGDGGLLGYSDGAAQTMLTCTAIQPASTQMDVDLATLLLQKQYVDVAVPIGPNIYTASFRPIKAEFDTDQKTGRLEGNFEFGGGATTRT